MSEVPGLAADLPKTRVRLFPTRLEEAEEGPLERPRLPAAVDAGLSGLMHRAEQLAADVELKLVDGRIADAYRFRPLVAAKPRDFDFPQTAFAGRSIQDLQLRRVAGDRA